MFWEWQRFVPVNYLCHPPDDIFLEGTPNIRSSYSIVGFSNWSTAPSFILDFYSNVARFLEALRGLCSFSYQCLCLVFFSSVSISFSLYLSVCTSVSLSPLPSLGPPSPSSLLNFLLSFSPNSFRLHLFVPLLSFSVPPLFLPFHYLSSHFFNLSLSLPIFFKSLSLSPFTFFLMKSELTITAAKVIAGCRTNCTPT